MFAFVTGSSQGLGLGIAKYLAKQGTKVCLSGRDEKKLIEVLASLDGSGHEFFCGDLTDKEIRQRLKDKFSEEGCPNIVIHCLGARLPIDQQPLSYEALEKTMQLNLSVSVELNEYLLPVMQKEQKGYIVHISSDSSFTGNSAPAYAASKAAINAYVKSTARYYVPFGVTVCAVLPSVIEHEHSDWREKKQTQPEHYQNKLAQMPRGRFSTVDEVASVVASIASSDNTVFSGSLIELPGGV